VRPLNPLGTAAGLAFGDGAGYPAELAARLEPHDLGEEALYLAWQLARSAGLDGAHERLAVLLLLAVLVAARRGSVRLPLSGEAGGAYLDEILASLGATPEDGRALRALLAELRSARLSGRPSPLDPLIGLPGERRPLVLDQYALYTERMRRAEEELAAALGARLARPAPLADPATIDRALADVKARPPLEGGAPLQLSDEQEAAVRRALATRLTVVSGGPGTGKTSVVATLLRVLARLDLVAPRVALAAPTGKAAQRMRQAIDRTLARVADPAPEDRALALPEAETLHRLLGYLPRLDRFRHHAQNPLAPEVVIVDEGSMIDLHLMQRLIAALAPAARLVLLGDADQLPSVEAGAVFRDLLPAAPTDRRAAAAVVLTHSYRMSPADPAGRQVLSLARRVLGGHDLEADGEGRLVPVEDAARLAFSGTERLAAAEDSPARAAFFARWLDERVLDAPAVAELARRVLLLDGDRFAPDDDAAIRAAAAHLERARLLCALRGRQPAGAGGVNQLLSRRFRARLHAGRGDDGTPRPGEPILVLRNDYDRGLWNGDQGLVLAVSRPGGETQRMAVFARAEGIAALPLVPLLPIVDLAYAMTVHKAQGSEVDHVALLLPDEASPLFTRELIYTAVTRARRAVTVVGDGALLSRAAARVMPRFSGLGRRLA
jgi:exodeoxyribonuclease V alpha subunit